uniref:TIL domain-containing protein n=1 Tax=Panagrellus redivivus TaxID=6233 RepID=A0A7E4V3J8_PANRE
MSPIHLITVLALWLSLATAQTTAQCGPNEVYTTCGSCEASCQNPNPMCTQECRPAGCYCPLNGFVRNASGSCVPSSTCRLETTSRRPRRCPLIKCIPGRRCIQPICTPSSDGPVPTCQPNEVYTTCGTCESTCANLDPPCTKNCRPAGCYCPLGEFVRNANGSCVPASTCRITVRPITRPTPIP